jgi:hypothetical protein
VILAICQAKDLFDRSAERIDETRSERGVCDEHAIGSCYGLAMWIGLTSGGTAHSSDVLFRSQGALSM